MKQIKVNKNCNGCGLCIVNCPYLQENEDGNAEYIMGKAIKKSDLDNVEKVVKECPQNALEIIEISSTKKSGTAGVSEIIAMLKEKANSFSADKVTEDDVKFDFKDYHIPTPYSRNEYVVSYSSESAAKSAAREEFRKLCYSENVYRPILRKMFVEFKVNVLKPYYTCEDTEESAYFTYNQQIRELLAGAYAEIVELVGNKKKIPENWKEFSVYLTKRDVTLQLVNEFDELSTDSGIISEFKSRGEYTSLSWYIDRMDFDWDEEYVGEGMFGRSKYKKKYHYSGFEEAAEEYFKDLMDAVNSRSDHISKCAANTVNSALIDFEGKVKKELLRKVAELEEYIK